MSKKNGIVNVRMVITEEKILSNIDKIQKMINPNSKKQIVQLDEDSYFKDMVESIKTYLIEYPKKKNFPLNVYKATYGLVEYATSQFEENTKKIEELIKQREENIVLAGELKETIEAVQNKQEGWKKAIEDISEKISPDIVETLQTLGRCKTTTSQTYNDAMKLLNARVNNLESNLHIEIDMERLEDSSKALSYIGIEIADALKLIPTPEEHLEMIAEQNEQEKVQNEVVEDKGIEELVENANVKEVQPQRQQQQQQQEQLQEQYVQDTTFEAKPSLWQRFKNSKIIRAATYIFRIKIRIELPNDALPEGRGE